MGRGSEDSVGFDLGGGFEEAGFNAPPVLGSWEDPGSLTQAPDMPKSLLHPAGEASALSPSNSAVRQARQRKLGPER